MTRQVLSDFNFCVVDIDAIFQIFVTEFIELIIVKNRIKEFLNNCVNN